MARSGELFTGSKGCDLVGGGGGGGGYFPGRKAAGETDINITLGGAHNEFLMAVHTSFHFYMI